jgi:hypothetical protein
MPRSPNEAVFPYPPRLIQTTLVGPTPLYQPRVRRAVVDALGREEKLGPEYFIIHDGKRRPFDRDALVRWIRDPNPVFLRVGRKRQIPYEVWMDVGHRPRLLMEFPPRKLKPAQLPLVFEAAELLAEAFRPDFGWVHLDSSVRLPSPDPEDVTQELMDRGCDGHPGRYGDYGPGGLGFRTIVGPDALKQLGRHVCGLRPPCVVRPLAWGGVSIDLLPEPWRADVKELHAQWNAVMEQLRPARFFATATVHDNGAVSYKKGPKCKLFGVKEEDN